MNEADEKILRRDFTNKFPGLQEAGSFGEVQVEIRRLEDGRVEIPAGDPEVIGSTFGGTPEIRLFAAACRGVFYSKPVDRLDEESLLCRAIIDGRRNPKDYVDKLVAEKTKAIRGARGKVKPRAKHELVLKDDAKLERILKGHDEI